MSLTVADYRELIRAEGATLLGQLERLASDDWARPSPCADWDILDVVVHMQLGTMIHTAMVENALADRMEPPWTIPEGTEAHTWFINVHRDAHAEGPAANVTHLSERLTGYDAALARATDADLQRPAWFYGLPATLDKIVSAFTDDLIVHASDVRRPLGLEPWFSPTGSRFVGPYLLPWLPMLVTAERLGGMSGVVRQIIDGLTSIATLGPDGVQIATEDGTSTASIPAASASLATDGGTWALLTWRQWPPADAERLGRLQISGDRALVERYLGAIKTP